MLISLLFKGHWYNVKVRGGIHAELTLRDDLLDRPVSFVFCVYFLLTYGLCMVILWHLNGFTYKVLFMKKFPQ